MARRIAIKAGDVSAEAELNDSHTADKIWNLLPIEGTVNTWGVRLTGT
ncbi:MAG: cyclophilin-like family protein [Chloroflexota bacterium]